MSDRSKADQAARLAILLELSRQPSARLSDTTLTDALEDWGHQRDEAFVRQQLRELENVGGVALFKTGVALIAEITRSGLNHVAGRGLLEGVKRNVSGS